MLMRRGLQAVQLFAGIMVIVGSAQLAAADGDGCTQSIRRWQLTPSTEWLQAGCNTGAPCGNKQKCTAHDPGGGYSICTCSTDGLIDSSKCQKGFRADDPPVLVDVAGVPKVKGSAACVQWTCTTPCEEDWDDVPGTTPVQQELSCICPP